MDVYVGIDVSKDVLDVALLSESGEVSYLKVTNDETGHQKVLTRLKGLSCQVIFEATGPYHLHLQTALQNALVAASVVNPRQVLNYAKSQNRRNKTDKVDALLLAQYGRERHPPVSPGKVPVQQSLARELAALNEDLGRLRNRLDAARRGLSHPDVVTSLEHRIDVLEKEKQRLEKQLQEETRQNQSEQLRLLQSIPGIGLHSACLFLAELGDPLRFRSARNLVAFAGLTPMRHESGKSRKYSAISRMGSAHLRRILYMPSVCASRWNPIIKGFYQQLVQRGKPKMVALVAAMAKLLRVMYGVLKSGKPFAPSITT
jgi:transposase